jgi:hypothetical protein
LRCLIGELVQDKLGANFGYSFDFERFYRTNRPGIRNFFNPLLTNKWKITRYLSYLRYAKYHYPKLLYVHNLRQSRVHMGLGLFYSSYRTADVWSYGAVLLAWSHDKIDYGVPLTDGYNYVSIGEREKISPDNLKLLPEYKERIVDVVQNILNNPTKQQEIVSNALKTYGEYYSNPKQFVQKIFIDKAKPF